MMAKTSELISAEEVSSRVARVAQAIADRIDDDWAVVCLLTGGIWFAADLMRTLYRLGRNPLFDALWLTSYGDAQMTSGTVATRVGLQRPVQDRDVLIVDDVFDSGLSLTEARRIVLEAGARQALTAVFARKPWAGVRHITPDFVAWDAPDRFLIGYGMDDGARHRGRPGVAMLDTGSSALGRTQDLQAE